MRRLPLLLLIMAACSSDPAGPPPADEPASSGDPGASGPSAPTGSPGPLAAADAAPPSLPSPPADAGSTAHPHDAGPVDAGPTCKKKVTVVFTVGVGASAVDSLSNGCWAVVDADGAANHQFRKCSTSSFVVHNASAPSYAYDDTSPSHPLGQEQTFLAQCSSGASGDGYVYMAYRSGWRLLSAPHVKAYF